MSTLAETLAETYQQIERNRAENEDCECHPGRGNGALVECQSCRTKQRIADIQAKLSAAEAGNAKVEAAWKRTCHALQDKLDEAELRAERAESERDALVARCAVYRDALIRWNSAAYGPTCKDENEAVEYSLTVMREPDAAAEELLKDRRRLEWVMNNWVEISDRLKIDAAMQEEAKADG